MQVGDVIMLTNEEYWKRRYTARSIPWEEDKYLLAPHVEWGLSAHVKYHDETNSYEFVVQDPRLYLLKCIEYGW